MTITPLPAPPSRQSPNTFANDSDLFLSALPRFQEEANVLAQDVTAKAQEVAQNLTSASAFKNETTILRNDTLGFKNSVAQSALEVASNTLLVHAETQRTLAESASAQTSAAHAQESAISAAEKVELATFQANTALQSAQLAAQKAQEIQSITVLSTAIAPGSQASVTYDAHSGEFHFYIPQGIPGEKGAQGESLKIDAHGELFERGLYDEAPINFSFLSLDTGELYFKHSNATADWSVPLLIGKGEQGERGNGIVDIVKTGTNGLYDTYTISFSDGYVQTLTIKNGQDGKDGLNGVSLEEIDKKIKRQTLINQLIN